MKGYDEMKHIKRPNNKPEAKRCRFCGMEYLDVGIEPGEVIMVPDCDCNKVTITLDREMLSNLLSYAKNGVTYSKLCNMLKESKSQDNLLEPELLQCQSNFCYIQEIIEKQVGINETEFTATPPGNTEIHNMVRKKVETTEEDSTTSDSLEVEGRQIKLPDGVKIVHKISKDKACKSCNRSYMENFLVFNENEIPYSVEPRCRCKEKVKVSLHKGDIMYLLGALSLGAWVERMCAIFYQAEGGFYDDSTERYTSIVMGIMDEIKTETGIELEYKGYGRDRWILGDIENYVNREADKSLENRDMIAVKKWDYRKEHAREKKGKK